MNVLGLVLVRIDPLTITSRLQLNLFGVNSRNKIRFYSEIAGIEIWMLDC